jgi:heme-degrading monooxygenase HmoA
MTRSPRQHKIGDQMYAHVNVWRLNAAGDSSSTAAAQEIADHLNQQPGFRSYTLIRTGEREVVAVTVFDTAEQFDAATRAVAGLVARRVDPLVTGPPERRAGKVIYAIAA